MTKSERFMMECLRSGRIRVAEDGSLWSSIKGTRYGLKEVPSRRIDTMGKDYFQVYITHEGTIYGAPAHRVVWMCHHGPIPRGLTINHINGIKTDNHISNLELATPSQQRRHALDVLKVAKYRPQGSLHHDAKLTEQDVVAIRRRAKAGDTSPTIAADYPVTARIIRSVVNGHLWRHVPLETTDPHEAAK